MAVTRSSAVERAPLQLSPRLGGSWRMRELAWTIAASLLVAAGLYLVYRAKTTEFPNVDQGLAAKKLLDLNNLSTREELLPVLSMIPDARQRQEAARRIYYLSGGLSNVGAVARQRGLLTGDQFREFKPLVVVRSPAQFRHAFLLWVPLFFAGFLLAHAWFSVRGFRGDETFLPAILLLTGIGLILMISLRDPVRDTLLFVDFAQGVFGGCVLLAAAATLDYERLFGNLSFVPLLASFGLSALLIVFGYGPGTSDAKVNLFGFQPVEIIRLLLVFFLAGYFAKRWDVLRHARERRPSVTRLTRHLDIPPLEYTIPVLSACCSHWHFSFCKKTWALPWSSPACFWCCTASPAAAFLYRWPDLP
jgi:hypothetical protein